MKGHLPLWLGVGSLLIKCTKRKSCAKGAHVCSFGQAVEIEEHKCWPHLWIFILCRPSNSLEIQYSSLPRTYLKASFNLQMHHTRNILPKATAPRLIIKAITKLTWLLSRMRNDPLSNLRLGWSSPCCFPASFWPATRFESGVEIRTWVPPSPSTIRPVRVSTTLDWNQPPRKLSTTLPSAPHNVINHANLNRWSTPHACHNSITDELSGQKGIRATDAATIIRDPSSPATRPQTVTPPFVPGGTCRRFKDVMSRGLVFDRIPSSELNVSAATAA